MQIITITSDWNDADYYMASLKGKILSACPDARIVDISHQVKPFHTAQAAFVVRNSYLNFPAGTIHLIAVNSEPPDGKDFLAARMAGQYFFCADNGILGLLGDPGPDLVVKISASRGSSFNSLTVFSDLACRLAAGEKLEDFGTVTENVDMQVPLRPTLEENSITGSVIHVDSFQNAITNISEEFFQRVGKSRDFRILVQSKHYTLKRISQRYGDVPEGELLALFNSVGLLEIAIRNGNAAGLLNLNTSSTIRIEFKEGKDA
jgi:S-adenosylmethionine hydrolase